MTVVVTPDAVDQPRTDVSLERGTSCMYEPDTGSYRARFDGDAPSPSAAVLDVLAAVEATDPVELPPLFQAVDPEALDALVSSAEPADDPLSVSFAYEGNDVTVTT